ncbi:MAG: hypothetical protein IPO81_09380 [Kouleothrix sp.]|nr:hypothetical protein [Kouleothrix sp.]
MPTTLSTTQRQFDPAAQPAIDRANRAARVTGRTWLVIWEGDCYSCWDDDDIAAFFPQIHPADVVYTTESALLS